MSDTKKTTTIFKLMMALTQGTALLDAGLQVVLAVEREDGSGHCWNVTGIDHKNKKVTVFVRTID